MSKRLIKVLQSIGTKYQGQTLSSNPMKIDKAAKDGDYTSGSGSFTSPKKNHLIYFTIGYPFLLWCKKIIKTLKIIIGS